MTKKFKELTLEFLINQYLFDIFRPQITGKKFGELFEEWRKEGKSCGILDEYPFGLDIFQRGHPLADEAIDVANKRIGRILK